MITKTYKAHGGWLPNPAQPSTPESCMQAACELTAALEHIQAGNAMVAAGEIVNALHLLGWIRRKPAPSKAKSESDLLKGF